MPSVPPSSERRRIYFAGVNRGHGGMPSVPPSSERRRIYFAGVNRGHGGMPSVPPSKENSPDQLDRGCLKKPHAFVG